MPTLGEPIGVPGVQGATIKAPLPISAHHVGVTSAACPQVSQLAVADSSFPFPFNCCFPALDSHRDISGSMQFQLERWKENLHLCLQLLTCNLLQHLQQYDMFMPLSRHHLFGFWRSRNTFRQCGAFTPQCCGTNFTNKRTRLARISFSLSGGRQNNRSSISSFLRILTLLFHYPHEKTHSKKNPVMSVIFTKLTCYI